MTVAMAAADRSAGAYTTIQNYSDSLESSVPARWSEKGTYARPKIRAGNNARCNIKELELARGGAQLDNIVLSRMSAVVTNRRIFSRCVRFYRLLFLFLCCLAVSIFLYFRICEKERSYTTVVNHVL